MKTLTNSCINKWDRKYNNNKSEKKKIVNYKWKIEDNDLTFYINKLDGNQNSESKKYT